MKQLVSQEEQRLRPCHYYPAIRHADIELIKYYVDQHVDPTARDENIYSKRSPLDYARQRRQPDQENIIDILKQYRSDTPTENLHVSPHTSSEPSLLPPPPPPPPPPPDDVCSETCKFFVGVSLLPLTISGITVFWKAWKRHNKVQRAAYGATAPHGLEDKEIKAFLDEAGIEWEDKPGHFRPHLHMLLEDPQLFLSMPLLTLSMWVVLRVLSWGFFHNQSVLVALVVFILVVFNLAGHLEKFTNLKEDLFAGS